MSFRRQLVSGRRPSLSRTRWPAAPRHRWTLLILCWVSPAASTPSKDRKSESEPWRVKVSTLISPMRIATEGQNPRPEGHTQEW